jgi:hypothetical protein
MEIHIISMLEISSYSQQMPVNDSSGIHNASYFQLWKSRSSRCWDKSSQNPELEIAGNTGLDASKCWLFLAFSSKLGFSGIANTVIPQNSSPGIFWHFQLFPTFWRGKFRWKKVAFPSFYRHLPVVFRRVSEETSHASGLPNG